MKSLIAGTLLCSLLLSTPTFIGKEHLPEMKHNSEDFEVPALQINIDEERRHYSYLTRVKAIEQMRLLSIASPYEASWLEVDQYKDTSLYYETTKYQSLINYGDVFGSMTITSSKKYKESKDNIAWHIHPDKDLFIHYAKQLPVQTFEDHRLQAEVLQDFNTIQSCFAGDGPSYIDLTSLIRKRIEKPEITWRAIVNPHVVTYFHVTDKAVEHFRNENAQLFCERDPSIILEGNRRIFKDQHIHIIITPHTTPLDEFICQNQHKIDSLKEVYQPYIEKWLERDANLQSSSPN